MTFKDLDEYLKPTIELPIGGKKYVVKSVDATTGLWCQRLMHTGLTVWAGENVSDADVASLELDDDQERNLYQRVLGDAYDEMVADGVPWDSIKHAGTTAFMWAAGNREQAEMFWASPGKARPAPQDRKPKKRSARPGSRAGSTSR